MNSKMQLVRDLAEFCYQRGFPLTAKALAVFLNAAGHRTIYGTLYMGKRGTYRLVKMTYRRLHRSGRTSEASMVAATYTKPNGGYAF